MAPSSRKHTFDNLQLDTESAEYRPARTDDSVHEKGSKMGWLRKPAIFGGSSNKRDKTPPRNERGPQSAARAESPPHRIDTSSARHIGSAARSHSPRSDLAYRSLDTRTTGDHSAEHDRSNHSHDRSNHSVNPKPVKLETSKQETSKVESEMEMKSQLEELKKEVKGLRDAFNSLKKEHGELRGELRSSFNPGRGGTFGSTPLPIEMLGMKSTIKPLGSDLGPSTSPQHLSQGGVASNSETLHPGKDLAVRGSSEGGVLRSIFESCGFGEQQKHVSPGLQSSTPENKRAPQQKASVKDQQVPRTKEQQEAWDAESSRQRAFYEGNRFAESANGSYKPFSLTHHTLEGGNSKTSDSHQIGGASSSSAQGTAVQRGSSPHDREPPMNMEGRGGRKKSGTGPVIDNSASGSPLSSPRSKVQVEPTNFGQPTHTWQGLATKGENTKKPFAPGTLPLPPRSEVPHSNETVPRFGLESDRKDKVDHVPLHGSSDIHSNFPLRVHHWKSPQAGEPLELPFPEIHIDEDEDEGATQLHKDESSQAQPGTIQRHPLTTHHVPDIATSANVGATSLQGQTLPQSPVETTAHQTAHMAAH